MTPKNEFKFVYCKSIIIGETKGKYIAKTTRKEISMREAVKRLKSKKYWGGFKGYAIDFRNGKFYYGLRRFGSFDGR